MNNRYSKIFRTSISTLLVFSSFVLTSCTGMNLENELKNEPANEPKNTIETEIPEFINTEISNVLDIKVGDYVSFGKYEQNGEDTDGPEDLIWKVVDIENGKCLLLSNYILKYDSFNETGQDITTDMMNDVSSEYYYEWDKSSIRNWLNNDFYNNAFSSDEAKIIITASNKTLAYEKLSKDVTVKNEIITEDKVFLLSLEEIEKIFEPEKQYGEGEKKTEPTVSTIAHYYKSVDEKDLKYFKTDLFCWILRDTYYPFKEAFQAHKVYYINKDGNLPSFDNEKLTVAASNHMMGIRPAIYVNEKEIGDFILNNYTYEPIITDDFAFEDAAPEETKVFWDWQLCNRIQSTMDVAEFDPELASAEDKGIPRNSEWLYVKDIDFNTPWGQYLNDWEGVDENCDMFIKSSFGDGKANGLQYRYIDNHFEVRIENSDSTGQKGANGAYPIVSEQ